MNVITRFAPSPTGYLHIGGARTAVFNWLLARSQGGKFLLRIEDTDRARSTKELTQGILDSMLWLGLDWDGEPIFQSERTDYYNELIDRLLNTGKAYHCHCTPEEVEAMREEARAKGLKPKYSGRCRELGLAPLDGVSVVRLKTPLTGRTVIDDLVKGLVSIENSELDDIILRRADGSPTYNLAVVADDAAMGVTIVLRGDDHLNNTPRQIHIYEALGFSLPRFGHVPMILGPDKKKLSKRHGAEAVIEYKEQGYLPEAMLNCLVRMGWGHGDQEIFSKEEMVNLFNVSNLSPSPAVFDLERLKWLNAHYIKETPPKILAELVLPFIKKLGLPEKVEYLQELVPLLAPRVKTLVELASMAECFLVSDDELSIDESARAKLITPEAKENLRGLLKVFADAQDFSQAGLESAVGAYLSGQDLPFKALAQPLRLALTGRTASPGIFEMLQVMGKTQAISRISRIIEKP